MVGRRSLSAGCCIAILLLTNGCKEPPPAILSAHGIVLLDGAPLPKANVRFIPQSKVGPEFIATGVTDDLGKYTLQCNGQPGACAGENIVLVAEGDIPKELQSETAQRELAAYLRTLKNRPIPPTYSSPVSSPLHAAVIEGQPEYKLELKR
jgi:hypothetical protein